MRNASDIFCLRDSERGEDDGTLLYSVNGACAVKNFRRRRFRYANEPEDIMVPRQPVPQQVPPPAEQVGSKSPRKSVSQSPRLKPGESTQLDQTPSYAAQPIQMPENQDHAHMEQSPSHYVSGDPNAFGNQTPYNINPNQYSPGGEAYYTGYQNSNENQNPYVDNQNPYSPNHNFNQPMYTGYQGSPPLNTIPEGPPGHEYDNYVEQNPSQNSIPQEYQEYPSNEDDDKKSDISHVSKTSQRSHRSQLLKQDSAHTPERTSPSHGNLKSQATQSAFQSNSKPRSSTSIRKQLFETGDSHSPAASKKSIEQVKLETDKIIQQTNKVRDEMDKINKSMKKLGSSRLSDKESTSSIARNPLTGDGMEIEANKHQKKYFKTKDQKWQW